MKQLIRFQTLSLCMFRSIPWELWFVLIFLVGFPVMASSNSLDVCIPYTSAPCQQNRTVDDVSSAFDNLTHHGEWLGFHNNGIAPLRLAINDSSEAKSWVKAHIQGLARSPRPGTPYLFVSCAGEKDSSLPEVGNLMVVKMGSRDTSGERLRSNRLEKGLQTSCTVSDLDDKVIYNEETDGYRHPGSIQMVGDILAIGLEEKLEGASLEDAPSKGLVRFYNMADPENPVKLLYELKTQYDDDEKVTTAGYLGITDLPDGGGFLLVTGESHGTEIHFWRSSLGKDIFSDLPGTDITYNDDNDDSAFRFNHYDVVYTREVVDENGEPGKYFVSTGKNYNNFQNLDLVKQTDGRIFMIPGRNLNPAVPHLPGSDVLALYEIKGFDKTTEFDKETDGIKITMIRDERVVTLKNDNSSILSCGLPVWDIYPPESSIWDIFLGGYTHLFHLPIWKANADLLAGGGTYVSQSGELLFYAVEHYNWGPLAPPVSGYPYEHPIVRVAELRNQTVVRDDSPTFGPIAHAGGTYVVDEGSTVALNGDSSRPPTAAPWVQLFEHSDYEGQSVMIDYEDAYLGKDDYDDFGKLDGQPLLDLCMDEELGAVINDPSILQDIWDEFISLEAIDFTKTLHYSNQWCLNGCTGGYNDCRGGCGLIIDDACKATCAGIKATCKGLWNTTCSASFACNCKCCNNNYNHCIADLCSIPDALCEGGCSTILGACEDTCNLVPSADYTVPDILGSGWKIARQYHDKMAMIGNLILDIPLCGRLLSPSLPAPPEFTMPDTLNPSKYDVDLSIPKNFEDFLTSFPDLWSVLSQAINLAEKDGEKVIEYVEYLSESLSGFNDRASSVLYYTPDGADIDIVLYHKADYKGGSLTLPRIETDSIGGFADLSTEQLTNVPGNASDRIRSAKFVGEFTPHWITGYTWSIVDPDPSYLILHDEQTSTPVFDASNGDGPMRATVELIVDDSNGRDANDFAKVEIQNVVPTVQIDRIDDERGMPVYDRMSGVPSSGIPVLLEALEYDLSGSFADAGIWDTHDSFIDWGDGQTNSSDEEEIFLFTDTEYGEGGSAGAPHIYVTKGNYPLVLEIIDDDGGVGQAELTVEVIDAIGALEIQIVELSSFIDGFADPDKSLLKALNKLLGTENSEGALGKFEKGQACSALEHIRQALKFIEKAVRSDPSLDLLEIEEQLTLVTKSSVSKAILAAESTALTLADWRKIERAIEYVAEGDALRDIGDFTEAVQQYRKALEGGDVCNNE